MYQLLEFVAIGALCASSFLQIRVNTKIQSRLANLEGLTQLLLNSHEYENRNWGEQS